MTLEERVKRLEEMMEFLLEKQVNKRWDKEQLDHLFMLWKRNPTDLNTITNELNNAFLDKGVSRRTPAAVACQIWKMCGNKAVLSEEIKNAAHKYMVKK